MKHLTLILFLMAFFQAASQDVPPAIFVGTLAGDHDQDLADDTLTYTLVAGNYGKYFFTAGNYLFVKKEAYSTFANYRSWRLVFEVCDRKNNCAIKIVTVGYGGKDIIYSLDDGATWTTVTLDTGDFTSLSYFKKIIQPDTNGYFLLQGQYNNYNPSTHSKSVLFKPLAQ